MYDTLASAKKGLTSLVFLLAGLLIVAMSALVIFQVFTRYVLGNPADWTEELVTTSLMWACFLCGAYALLNRQHMALHVFRDKLPTAARRLVTIAVDALVLAFAAVVMVWGGIQLVLVSLDAPSAILQIPRGLAYAAAPVGGLLMVAAQILNLFEDVSGETLPRTNADDDLEPSQGAHKEAHA